MKIVVVDNQIEPALKALKKEMLKGGVFKENRLKAARRSPATAE